MSEQGETHSGSHERGAQGEQSAQVVGRMVENRDVIRCASPKCKTCLGTGVLTLRPVGGKPVKRNCGCALKRFVKAHARDIEEVPTEKPGTVNLRWLAGHDPVAGHEPAAA